MPRSESFLASREVLESYLPADWSIDSFDFSSCSKSNCNDFSSDGKQDVLLTVILSQWLNHKFYTQTLLQTTSNANLDLHFQPLTLIVRQGRYLCFE